MNKKTLKSWAACVAGLAAGLCLTSVAMADNPPATKSVSLAGFYLTGNYGRTQSTDIYYVPLTFRMSEGRFSYSISLPYLSKTGPSNVLPNIGSVGTGSSMTTTNSGMGDIRLSANYRVWEDADSGLAWTVGTKVKLGTASFANGLGTGKTDYALQTGISRAHGPLYLALIAGYRKQGSPSGLKLRNVAYGEADVIYVLSHANSVGLSTFYTEASLSTGTSRVMSAAYFKHSLTSSWSTTAYAMKGYTRSSPDWGAGVSIRYGF